ncbi:hypothetical protein [Paraurantiacibacter namhicola]|uniref:Uncharacterized protein n=1 Tax=Paraurantiacibacter namhicola TaxID=645517 RepID=A0A1C7D4T6_9SPHN|nr:hypothetical protein [Paraurantiacibacter namhicola]ANU06478.1 hypothetical protein A6F65_00150 [Paraurantiacibacter namhicola]
MADQWIAASTALELGIDRMSLCARLHKGEVLARASSLHRGDQSATNANIPKEFWWAEGHGALEQDWQTGDFATSIERGDFQGEWQAFGVKFSLSSLLMMLPFELRPEKRRVLSVAGNDKWIPADDARQLAYHCGKENGSEYIVEQARLGFLVGVAVEAHGASRPTNFLRWDWEEREWEIPDWFWSDFARPIGARSKWEIGFFAGEGSSPIGSRYVEVSGVHFLRSSVAACLNLPEQPATPESSGRVGRRPKYDWPSATLAVFGLIHRGDFKPSSQADVERCLIQHLTEGENSPSESTVRPYAKLIWEEAAKV